MKILLGFGAGILTSEEISDMSADVVLPYVESMDVPTFWPREEQIRNFLNRVPRNCFTLYTTYTKTLHETLGVCSV